MEKWNTSNFIFKDSSVSLSCYFLHSMRRPILYIHGYFAWLLSTDLHSICECEYITSLKYLLSFLFIIIYILMIILRYNYIITKLVFIIVTKICLLLEKLYLFFIWLSNFFKYEIFPKITNIKIVELIKNLWTLLKNLNKIRGNITNWFKYFWYIDILKKDQYIFFR